MARSKSTPETSINFLSDDKSGVIRVLLVDGDESTIEKLSQILSNSEGIMLIGKAKGVEDALTRINNLSPDVIIMLADCRIPAMDHIDTISAICQAQLPGGAIIMIENPTKYLGLAIKTGATALLPKNIFHEDLVSAIRKVHLWSQDCFSLS